MTTIQFICAMLGSGTVATVLTFLTNRIRSKAYSGLSHATSKKRLAEAVKIKADAELSIAEFWMSTANLLQKQIDTLKKEQLDERKQCDAKIDLLRKEQTEERRQCDNGMAELRKEIELLKKRS